MSDIQFPAPGSAEVRGEKAELRNHLSLGASQPFSSTIDRAMRAPAGRKAGRPAGQNSPLPASRLSGLQSSGVRDEAAPSSRPSGGKNKIVRLPKSQSSEDAATTDEWRDGAEEADGNAQFSTLNSQQVSPDNIVPFPSPSVIVPFPLEEAVGTGAKEGKGAGGNGCEDAEENSPLVPFPLSRALDSRETQLPGVMSESEDSAPTASRKAGSQAIPQGATAGHQTMTLVQKDGAPAGHPAMRDGLSASSPAGLDPFGTSGARQEGRMESLKNSDGAERGVSSSEPGTRNAEPGSILDLSVGSVSATDWQTGRPVSGADRPASEFGGARAADAAATVERISGLVMREVALVRQHSSDSMAVVLRPDAETELLVHFTRRDGQIEAFVRCERGDAHQLGALWPQLQETLAHQRVRLAPLTEASSNYANFNHASGSGRNGGGHGADRQPAPERQSLDEWPAPASQGSAHVRGRGGSRHRRVTTSRPGWETWA